MAILENSMEECKLLEFQGADEFQATEHLTDEEFRYWYLRDNKKWWDSYKKYHNILTCERCSLEIKGPDSLGSWGGTMYHISCMIEELASRDLTGNDKSLYDRIKKVFV